jgi:hypothetical protein
MRDFQLIRLLVGVNGTDTQAIVDTGAVYSIVTESFARRAGVREIPNSQASGRGLHQKEFPVTFGVIETLQFGGFTVRDVPVMLMPDDALLFETSRGPFSVPGAGPPSARSSPRHRTAPGLHAHGPPRGGPRRLGLFFGERLSRARLSIAAAGHLLDTEASHDVTSTGVQRGHRGNAASTKALRLGKSGEWMRVDAVTIGVGAGVRFCLVVRRTRTPRDGILGSFLKNFRVASTSG